MPGSFVTQNPHLRTTTSLLGPPPRRRHEISLFVPEGDAIGKCCDNFVTVQLHINDDAIAGAYQIVVDFRVGNRNLFFASGKGKI